MAKWVEHKSKSYGGDEANRKMEERYEEYPCPKLPSRKTVRTTGFVLTVIGLILTVSSLWLSTNLLILGIILLVMGLGTIWATESMYYE